MFLGGSEFYLANRGHPYLCVRRIMHYKSLRWQLSQLKGIRGCALPLLLLFDHKQTLVLQRSKTRSLLSLENIYVTRLGGTFPAESST